MYNNVIVIENDGAYEKSYDIYSRLLKDRIIFIGDKIDNALSNSVVAQLLFLESEDSKKDVTIYINSPGGVITSGFAILDTMKYIKPDVATICIGQASSFGALILACGTKGKRFSLPNSRIMLHQPLGGTQGQASDIKIHAEEIIKNREKIENILSSVTGQSKERISLDCDRDLFFSAEEAISYGLIDRIIGEDKWNI
jgi:ATP-dependent Clp protease protease subunit